jgi:hypothetical protein
VRLNQRQAVRTRPKSRSTDVIAQPRGTECLQPEDQNSFAFERHAFGTYGREAQARCCHREQKRKEIAGETVLVVQPILKKKAHALRCRGVGCDEALLAEANKAKSSIRNPAGAEGRTAYCSHIPASRETVAARVLERRPSESRRSNQSVQSYWTQHALFAKRSASIT